MTIINLESKRPIEYTIIIVTGTDNSLQGFLSIDSTTEKPSFTNDKDRIALHSETEAIRIKNYITENFDGVDVDFIQTNAEIITRPLNLFRFEIAKVDYIN